MSTIRIWGALLLFPFVVSLVSAEDWPQWRGPNRDGISTEKGLLSEWPEEGPELVWEVKKGIGRGYSSVAVADGRVFTIGSTRQGCMAFCFDEKTGKELWATPFAPKDGNNEPRSTPTVSGDKVYVLSRQGNLACLDVKNGQIVWFLDYKKDFGGRMMSGWDYSESILVDGDSVICTPGSEEVAMMAVNKNNGEVRWKAKMPNTGGSGYASIIIANVGGIKQYITLYGRCIAGFRADNGEFLWRYNRVANGTANIPTPIVEGDLVFCSTAYGRGSALLKLVPTDGGIEAKEIYFLEGRKLQNHHGGIIKLGDYIYGGHGHNDGQPFCLEMKTGKFAWGPERGVGQGSAAVVYADGHFYFRYQDGTMALIKATPKGYQPVSQFSLPRYVGTPSWAHPVIANGKLFIRGNDCLLCYNLKK